MSWNERSRTVTSVAKRGAEATANGVHAVTSFVARNDGRVADGTQVVAQILGSGLDKAGDRLASASQHASRSLHSNASRLADAAQNSVVGTGPSNAWRKGAGLLAWGLTKVATHTVGVTANAVTMLGKVTAVTGRVTERSAPAVGGALGGVVRGAVDITSNAVDAAALPASSIDAMRSELRTFGQAEMQRAELLMQKIESAKQGRRKAELLDLLVVGGITLAQAIRNPAGVPPEVENAFDLAYPGLAQTESFAQAVNRMSSDELAGLVSGVKGKLFELELVDHLNNGGLPDGFHAAMAHSATQPGWDIQITDAHGQVSELLQAKATESASYVQDALERYPNIDVTTTSEVHGQLVAMGLAQDVHNSGISEAVLQAKVEAATHGGAAFDATDLVPSSIGLAVIALSVFMNQDSTLREKGAAFGTRSAMVGVSGAVGKVAMVATQTWWLGLIAGVGTRWLANRGHGKREQYEALRGALKVMRNRKLFLLTNGSRPVRQVQAMEQQAAVPTPQTTVTAHRTMQTQPASANSSSNGGGWWLLASGFIGIAIVLLAITKNTPSNIEPAHQVTNLTPPVVTSITTKLKQGKSSNSTKPTPPAKQTQRNVSRCNYKTMTSDDEYRACGLQPPKPKPSPAIMEPSPPAHAPAPLTGPDCRWADPKHCVKEPEPSCRWADPKHCVQEPESPCRWANPANCN